MRLIITAKAKNKEFPWENGVLITLQGDNSLQNTIDELIEVKKMINADANRHGLALADLDVTLDWVQVNNPKKETK